MSKKHDKNETHFTPSELAAAIATQALTSVLRDEEHWLEDSSPHYRRRALDAIERLALKIAKKANLDLVLPERTYSND